MMFVTARMLDRDPSHHVEPSAAPATSCILVFRANFGTLIFDAPSIRTQPARHSLAPALVARMLQVPQQSASAHKRKYAAHSDDMRAAIVRMRDGGLTWSQIEAVSGVPSTTAQSIVAVQQTEGRTAKKHKGGNHHAVISDAVKRCITALQTADATLRLQGIANLLDSAFFGGSPCLNTIWRVLHDAGFTTKALSAHAAPRNTLRVKEKRRDWCRDVGSTLTAATAIFIDESPFSFCITRTRGRSPKGQEAVTTTPAIRGKNHTVIAALSPTHGLIHYEIKVTEPDTEFISKRKGSKKKKTRPKGVTRETFRSFLINMLAKPPFANISTHFTLLFDNAKIHLGDIADTIFQAGYVQQLLPSYSPALNPIEYAFSKWKLAYRALHPDSEQAVDDAIRRTAPSITPANCQQWFVHTQSLYDKCLAMEDL